MMTANGLAKLLEESGELQEVLSILQQGLGRLQQVAGKKLAYYATDEHPDGNGSLQRRLEDEIADVSAALKFFSVTAQLDTEYITTRANKKYNRFLAWHEDMTNNTHGVDAQERKV